jgi:hypothetical protein
MDSMDAQPFFSLTDGDKRFYRNNFSNRARKGWHMANAETTEDDGVRFEIFLRKIYPGGHISSLSDTNNRIYKVKTAAETLSAKLMLDADIPLDYFVGSSKVLQGDLPVQRVGAVYRETDGAPFDCIISEYVEGIDLATALREEGVVEQEKVIQFFGRYIAACAKLDKFFDGFGVYKLDGPMFDSFADYIDNYANKYWARARSFFDHDTALAVDGWISRLRQVCDAAEHFRPVAIDSNLRNFVVDDSGGLILLNVPIVAWSCRAHAVGAVSAHLRSFPLRELWLQHATNGWPSEERAMVAHFEAWTLLGILSFYAVREPERPDKWRNWGSTRNLRDDFAELILELSPSG